MQVDLFRQPRPFMIYKRFQIDTVVPRYWGYALDKGYKYIPQYAFVQYNKLDAQTNTELLNYTIQLVKGNSVTIGLNPADMKNFISPAGRGGFYTASPAPVDLDNFGISFSASPIKNWIKINTFFEHREVVGVRVAAKSLPNVQEEVPSYIDVCLHGTLVYEEQDVETWGGV